MSRLGSRFWLWTGAVLALAGLAVVGLRAGAPVLVRRGIEIAVGGLGVGPLEMEVRHASLHRVELARLQIGTRPDLYVEELVAEFTPRGLLSGRLERLEADGLRLRAELGPGGLSLGALDPLLDGGGDGAGFPASALEVRGGEVQLQTAAGPLEIGFELALAATAEALDGPLGVRLQGRELAGDGWTLRELALALDATLQARPGSLALTLRPGGTLRLADLEAGRLEPAELTLQLEGSGSYRDGSVQLEARVRGDAGALDAHVEGSHEVESGSGAARFRLEPLRLGPRGIAPGRFFPALRGRVRSARGTLTAAGQLRWWPGRLDSALELEARALAFELDSVDVEGLEGRVVLERVWPPATAARQRIAIAQLDVGVPLKNAVAVFTIERSGILDLEALDLETLGGRLHASSVLDPSRPPQRVELEVSDVELDELLAQLELSGLTGQGKVSGRIPVEAEGGRLFVRDAELSSTSAGGWIRYRPAERPENLPPEVGVDLLLSVLDDFRYESLRATLRGELDGVLEVMLHMRGANPAVQNGHPVEFNLSLTSPLSGILRDVTTDFSRIGRRLQKWEHQEE